MTFNYSVQLYSVRTELRQNPLETLRKLRGMGYSGVEGFGDFRYTPSDISRALCETGLELVGYHTEWDDVQDAKLETTVQYFKAIGNRFVMIPGLPEECTASIDAWKRTAEKFNLLSRRLGEEGLSIGYHIHGSEFKAIGGQIPFTVFFDNTDPAVVMQMDNGNALSCGGDFMAMMRKYPGRQQSVHLKPYAKNGGYAPIIGQDDIDWPEFLRWCRDHGETRHYIVEYEHEAAHPQMEGVELCLRALKGMESI